jgi:hypothetical protein
MTLLSYLELTPPRARLFVSCNEGRVLCLQFEGNKLVTGAGDFLIKVRHGPCLLLLIVWWLTFHVLLLFYFYACSGVESAIEPMRQHSRLSHVSRVVSTIRLHKEYRRSFLPSLGKSPS